MSQKASELGRVTEERYHLTQQIATGEIEGEEYTIGLDMGSGSIIINFPERKKKVFYTPKELLENAIEKVVGHE